MTFLVEISNPTLTDGNPYEVWKLATIEDFAQRIESETGWSRADSLSAAEEVVAGSEVKDEDAETGRVVTARRVKSAVIA
jgi:hypothetical protein